jgi:hypothetical protein
MMHGVVAHRAGGDEPLPPPAFRGGTVDFAGRSWQIKQGAKLGPGPNRWASGNVRVATQGQLDLRIVPETDERWSCAEARVARPLGYGEYRWTIAGDLDALDAQAVLGLFLYQDDNREFDFELSRWVDKGDTWNAQFAVMPSEDDATMLAKGRIHRFSAAGKQALTISLLWTPGKLHARCWSDDNTNASPLADWHYAWPNGRHEPDPREAHCIMNLWLIKSRPPQSAKPQQITIRSFAFTAAK